MARRVHPVPAWCGLVWCGVGRNGGVVVVVVVWRGVAWRNVVWCGVVLCGVVWCGVVWCGVAWCGVVWCGVVWRGVVWCGVVWCSVVCCGVGHFIPFHSIRPQPTLDQTAQRTPLNPIPPISDLLEVTISTPMPELILRASQTWTA